MQDLRSPLEEQSLFESWIITSHLSSMHHELASAKKFKKIIKNDSPEAFKINTFSYYNQIIKKEVSKEVREKFDDFIYQSEKSCSLLQSLNDLKLYPLHDFPLWNKHLELYESLENNDFCEPYAQHLQDFLFKNFLILEYKYIEIDILMERDFNILLVLFHLDSLIFRDFQQASILKFLLIGKIKGQQKSIHHKFWNIVKILSCIEANQKLNTSFNTNKKVPKDEDCFSFLNEDQAERIKYAVRKLKEGKSTFFYLSHFYQLLGAKKLFENTQSFNHFSITGLWIIYIYSIILIKPNSILCNSTSKDLDAIFLMFKYKYRSEGKYSWPSDLVM